jgi:hypothetical protein
MVEGVWEKYGAFVHQQIVWAKDRGMLTRSYYLWQHEPCFFGWLRGNKPPKGVGRLSEHGVGLADGEGRRENRSSDIAGRGVRHPDAPAHAARGGLLRAVLRLRLADYRRRDDGSRVFAIEISPQYVDVAVKRWQTTTGKPATLDGDGRAFDEITAERLLKAA